MGNDELGNLEWLVQCTPRERAAIRRHADVVDIPAGSVLVREGAPARWFYAIVDGTAAVSIDGELIDRKQAGDPVNELEMLRNEVSPVTVTAQTDLRILTMGRREFLGMLDEVPGLARRLLMPHIPDVAGRPKRKAVLVPLPAA